MRNRKGKAREKENEWEIEKGMWKKKKMREIENEMWKRKKKSERYKIKMWKRKKMSDRKRDVKENGNVSEIERGC